MKCVQCHKANRPYSGQPRFTLRQFDCNICTKVQILTICINHVSSFCKLNALTSVLHVYVRYANIFESSCIGSLPPLLPNTPFLKISPSPRSTFFKYKLINPDFTPPPTPLSGSRPLSLYPPALITLQPEKRQLGTGPMPQSL